MEIIVNGQSQEVPIGYTAEQLVNSLELAGKRIAMEVNEEIVPKSGYSKYAFTAGDRVEVVHAVGGG